MDPFDRRSPRSDALDVRFLCDRLGKLLLISVIAAFTLLALFSPVRAWGASPGVVYLPLLIRMPSPAPSATPTATVTPTPTRTATFAPSPTATATSLPVNDLRITQLEYSGRDEYVEITNHGPSTQVTTGWRLHSVVGDQWYTFPPGSAVAAGTFVRVHSGPDALHDPPTDLHWTTRWIWNNSGDEARLYDDHGTLRDGWSY